MTREGTQRGSHQEGSSWQRGTRWLRARGWDSGALGRHTETPWETPHGDSTGLAHTVLWPRPVLTWLSLRPAVPSHIGCLTVRAGLTMCVSRNRKPRQVSDGPRGSATSRGPGTRRGTLAAAALCVWTCAGTPGCVWRGTDTHVNTYVTWSFRTACTKTEPLTFLECLPSVTQPCESLLCV